MYNSKTDDQNHLQRDASWLSESTKKKTLELMDRLHYAEVDLTQAVADVLRAPNAKRVGPGGLLVLKRGGLMLIVMLVLAIGAMLFNPTLGLVILFLAGAQVFATAYAYQVVAKETIINLRMSLLGMLMAFALALLAFIGLFF